MEDKPWHIAPSTKQTAVPPEKKYILALANASDISKVQQFYAHHPVAKYGIAKVEVIVNPEFNRAFSLELSRLQEKANNPAFMPKWEQMEGAGQRQHVMETWKTLTQSYTDSAYPAVSLVPAWHGTRSELLDSIFRIGYSNLSFTDDGYFGKGLYSAYEAEYAYRVYSKGALIVNWVASFLMLPVIHGDMELLQGKGNYGNYDGHFVPVAPRYADNPQETVYYPCRFRQAAQYHEIVVFQTAACLPRYLVTLQADLIKNPLPLVKTVNTDPYLANVSDSSLGQRPTEIKPFNNADYSTDPHLPNLLNEPQTEIKTANADYSTDPYLPNVSDASLSEPQTAWQPSEAQRQQALAEGQLAMKKGRYIEAREQLERLTEGMQSVNPKADVLLGWLYANAIYPSDEKAQQSTQTYCAKAYDETQQRSQAYYAKAYAQKATFVQNQSGDAEAQYELGLMYLNYNQATPEERQEGIAQLTLAAKQNHAGAQRELGRLYQAGKGVAANAQTAMYCYQSAAQGGDARAMYYLAVCLAHGRGAAKDQAQAVKWYQQSADLGDALAQNSLGLCYEQGNGVKQDYAQAAHYYQQSGNQGNVVALMNLGIIYENGRPSVEKNLVKAAQCYHLAAAQGFVRAQNNLAGFYDYGLGGMPKDPKEAFRLYKAAADQGYARAQYNVGICYETGKGTDKDLQQAKHYYTLAANANERISPEAKKSLTQLEQQLSTAASPAAITMLPSSATPFWSLPNNPPTMPQGSFQLPPQNQNRPF